MLEFPIVDAHLHLWNIKKFKYPWLDEIPFLNKTFLLGDYNRACGPIKVEKMVFVQCECEPIQYKDEIKWISELSLKEDNRIAGIVSWAPLEKGEAVRAELEELADNKLIKGIRRIIQFEEDVNFCLKPDFIKGVKLLPEFNFAFDICISSKHIRNVIKLVEKCNQVTFILDHIGKPDIKNRIENGWREEIGNLSQFPNVWCKVSSLATEADHNKWEIEELRPYVNHIFECFGFDRTIFAGDWPVSSQAADYPVCVDTLEKLVEGCSKDELKKLFYDNAVEFYKLSK